ncbi:Eco57I restriction-modification methylase domain-containing protein [Halobacterium yunchengense]|uniref:Eco57I restriction-modification methylase domain-containing protein n=1 Tax=Halobacterium yunchengense TaxID=3108497 RepID=UPI003008100C
MSQATLGSTPYQNSSLFSGYYLDERIYDLDDWDCDEEASEAFDDLQVLWDLERDLVDSYNEDELLDAWIDEVLDVLGYDTLSETTIPDGGGHNDRLLFDSGETRRNAAKRKKDGDVEAAYSLASVALEAKQWNADFTARFSEQRSYRDASHQIKYYLEHTPDNLQWGILTDGRKWRLYGTKDYATEIYYEVDLPELLDSGSLEQFKYFYAFFRPEAFHETAGTSFLDTVWNESETAAQELGEDLQDNVFTALRVLGEGFLHTNDLDIDPDDEAARAELKEQSLVLLYRLMFVLYAESRGLIHPEDPDKQDEYEEHFSLTQLRSEIHDDIQSGDDFEDYSGHSTQKWSRLEDLFDLVDEGEQSLGIPPYNGGLFDDDQHEFLANNEVSDRHIAEVIYRLGTTEGDDDEFVLADYADLDTRHLGSIYEGLLEHEFRIASEQYAAVAEDGGQVWKPATEVSVADAVETVDEGELYVVNDDGERKATGAYYTPDYVVSYIVEETVDPLLEDIKADLRADGLAEGDREFFRRFWQAVKDLKILDPAMGSAHFLTSATGYLTEQVMEVVREQEIQSYDEQHLRREIAKECIYGVDVNGMAVELGKLSMWLETLAADQPLAFLDHHLKTGNSLVGSDITEVLSDDVDDEGGQLTLMQAAARARKNTLEHVMELMQELLAIDNETLEDIKSMEEIYDEIRDDPLYQRLFEIANVHTAEEFGLDVPEGVYEEMAGAIDDADDWAEIRGEDWFASAQAMADEEDFFHWELEYPEVFFGQGGEKREDAGFDAVIGNPPWGHPGENKDYLKVKFSEIVKRLPDTFAYFTEEGLRLGKDTANYGLILPSVVLFQSEYSKLRRELIGSGLSQVSDLGEGVFADAVAPSAVIIGSRIANTTELSIRNLRSEDPQTLGSNLVGAIEFPIESVLSEEDAVIPTYKIEHRRILSELQEQHGRLGSRFDVEQGIQTGGDEAFTVSESEMEEYNLEEELLHPVLFGSDVTPFFVSEPNRYILYIERDIEANQIPQTIEYLEQYRGSLDSVSEVEKGIRPWYTLHRPRNPDIFEQSKVLLRQTGDTLIAGLSSDDTYTVDSLLCITPKKNFTDLETLVLLLNSTLLRDLYDTITQEKGRVFSQVKPQNVKKLPLPSFDHIDSRLAEASISETEVAGESVKNVNSSTGLAKLHSFRSDLGDSRANLNLELLDHLGAYSTGDSISEVGFSQPPEQSADSILQKTTEQKPNLRVGGATVKREDDETVEIRLTARYKPDDEDGHETDQWGYTETEPLPALRITDLTETEADLVEAFVPVAVDEAGGFANFRETATKTNSLVDRLRSLTLPAVDDVEDGLQSYLETKERAEELDEQIERTDELIDEIVYELYGLTDEEIEIVEETVSA